MCGVIKKRIDRKDDLSLNQMAKQLNISRKSIQMTVKNELGLLSIVLSGQILAGQAKQNWKEKRKKLWEFFKVRRIEDALCSDEKVFTLKAAKYSQYYLQLLSPGLKNNRKRKTATRSLFPESLMVWGSISATDKTFLMFSDKIVKINAEVYQEKILEKVVVPWKQKHSNFIIQQNWATARGAKTTIHFSETKISSFLTKDLWPLSSPDLNPLDFSVWGFIEEQLWNRYVKKLVDLIEIWNNPHVNYLRRTIDSLKKRIDACIKADGGHFGNTL
ncbi:hypothetical protein Y032_0159g3320 [Ancylostoma ceylanicum]|uniref:Tc1-like transposase DDE domain-containing protein n=1 Tax=Ancylostoma ceylanicum TaxID=53326 RepID=A0A016SYN1_9BILA|nr:hypothetical protein Y032_0159g3320 [Ancylostoma ceylanicum]